MTQSLSDTMYRSGAWGEVAMLCVSVGLIPEIRFG